MKKQKIRWLRLIFSGAAASALCVFLSYYIMVWAWSFDIFSAKQWRVISRYWNSYGVISKGVDYLFFLTLFMAFVCVFFLWGLFYSVDFGKLISDALLYFWNRDIRRYQNEDLHIKLKNMSSSEKKTLEEFIDEHVAAETDQKEEMKNSLTQVLREKITKKFLRRGE